MKMIDEISERIIIHSVIDEGLICSDGGVVDVMLSVMSEEDFTNRERRDLFVAIKEQRSKNHDIDTAFLSHLSSNNEYLAGEIDQLNNLMTTQNIKPYTEKVKTATSVRRSKHVIDSFNARLESGMGNPSEVINSAILELNKCNTSRIKTQDFTAEHISSTFFTDFKEIQESGNDVIGLRSGISSLDKNSGGFRDGDLTVIGALPGMGKTTLAISIIAKMVLEGKSPALFTYEMSRFQTISNILSAMSAYDSNLITLGRQEIERGQKTVTSDKLQTLQRALQIYKDSKGYYADRSIQVKSLDSIRSTCYKLKSEGRLDALFVDHAGLLVENFNTEREELANITGGLKRLAGELEIPVFLLSQLNERKGERIERPTMGMLKGSSTLEADADTILFPWRRYAIDKSDEPEKARLFIGKSRNFSSDDIPMIFDTNSICFFEGEEDEQKEDTSKNTTNYESHFTGRF